MSAPIIRLLFIVASMNLMLDCEILDKLDPLPWGWMGHFYFLAACALLWAYAEPLWRYFFTKKQEQ